MKKSILYLSILATGTSFAQENCINVIDRVGNPVYATNNNPAIAPRLLSENSECIPAKTSPILARKEVKALNNALLGVKFANNSDEILTESNEKLDAVAMILDKKTNYKLNVDGYTDNVGDDNYNLELSNKRAIAVKQYLLKKGIESNRINAIGHGEANPVATNDTEEGRAQNRRVEFNIVY